MFSAAIQQVHAMSPETLNISHFTFLLAKVAENCRCRFAKNAWI